MFISFLFFFFVATFNLAPSTERTIDEPAIGMCVLYACVDYAADRLQTITFFFCSLHFSDFVVLPFYSEEKRERARDKDLLLFFCCCQESIYGTKLVIHYIFVTLQLHAPNATTKNDPTKE